MNKLRFARALGAGALLVVGGVHLEQYTVAHFSVIPTIGPLFLLTVITVGALGLFLLVPMADVARSRRRLWFDSIAALAGVAVASGALAGLLISEQTPLFGFMEHGYRLEIVIAIAAEVVAIVSLGAFLAIADRRAHERQGEPEGRVDRGKPPTTPSPAEV
jgi:hypothetical protein